MKPLKVGSGGYTIIEVMIFLTVSMAMFASVVGLVTSQNRKNQFTESVNTFNQNLQDIINDIDTGYFPSNSDFNCVIDGAGKPAFGTTAREQGKNQDCVFAGKSIAVNTTDRTNFIVQTLVGRRTVNEGGTLRDVKDINEANLTPLTGGSARNADNGTLSADVQITKIRPAGSSADYTMLGVLTGFGQSSGAGTTSLKTGATKSQLAIFNPGTNQWDTNLTNGILICLAEGGNPAAGRRAVIQLGGSFSQQVTSVKIDSYEGCE